MEDAAAKLRDSYAIATGGTLQDEHYSPWVERQVVIQVWRGYVHALAFCKARLKHASFLKVDESLSEVWRLLKGVDREDVGAAIHALITEAIFALYDALHEGNLLLSKGYGDRSVKGTAEEYK